MRTKFIGKKNQEKSSQIKRNFTQGLQHVEVFLLWDFRSYLTYAKQMCIENESVENEYKN
jgi:hypothetical protein